VAEEVAPLVWTSLSARLREARRELEELLTAFRRDHASGLRDECALARQEELREGVRRAGWCLGALGAVQGVDLLRTRRAEDGLRWLSAALAEACGFTLTPGADELPRDAGAASDACERSLLASWCVLLAGGGDGVVRWSAERVERAWRLGFELGRVRAPAELAERCARLSSARPGSTRVAFAPSRIELAWQGT
jgi:hypothetical protein